VYRRDVSEWQGFKWLLPIIALASLAIGIFVFTDDERDLTMEEQLATQGVVMDIQILESIQNWKPDQFSPDEGCDPGAGF